MFSYIIQKDYFCSYNYMELPMIDEFCKLLKIKG